MNVAGDKKYQYYEEALKIANTLTKAPEAVKEFAALRLIAEENPLFSDNAKKGRFLTTLIDYSEPEEWVLMVERLEKLSMKV